MVRHSPLSAAATAGSNSSNSISNAPSSSSSSSSVKPVQHQLDRASAHFEGFIVDLMDRITNVRRLSSTVLANVLFTSLLFQQSFPFVTKFCRDVVSVSNVSVSTRSREFGKIERLGLIWVLKVERLGLVSVLKVDRLGLVLFLWLNVLWTSLLFGFPYVPITVDLEIIFSS